MAEFADETSALPDLPERVACGSGRNVYDAGMSKDAANAQGAAAATPEKLALAQQAFERFHTRCFWFMRADAQITAEDVPEIVRGLRAHGNREAFLIAAELCR